MTEVTYTDHCSSGRPSWAASCAHKVAKTTELVPATQLEPNTPLRVPLILKTILAHPVVGKRERPYNDSV
eukprot:4792888-Amphidinium_carterae.2